MTSLAPFYLPEPIVALIPPTYGSILKHAIAELTEEQFADLPEPSPAEQYTRRVLVDTPQLLVIAARWRAGARSDLHGHSESAGLYRVVRGALEEERYVAIANALSFSASLLEAGDESFLPRGSFHQLSAAEVSVTVHAYAPRPADAVSELSQHDLLQIDRARRVAGESPVGAIRQGNISH